MQCVQCSTCTAGYVRNAIKKLKRASAQLIFLTYDDAVTAYADDNFYKRLFNGEITNPNNCPITATHFVSHQYNDYSLVSVVLKLHEFDHFLILLGHSSINSHPFAGPSVLLEGSRDRRSLHHVRKRFSISLRNASLNVSLNCYRHRSNTTYWRTLPKDGWVSEIVDMRYMLNKYAKVPLDDIIGEELKVNKPKVKSVILKNILRTNNITNTCTCIATTCIDVLSYSIV